MTLTDLTEIENSAIDLVKQVGRFILEEAAVFSKSAIENKGLNDLVSYVDKEAEKMLVNGLLKILPESGFIVEEGTISKEGAYTWIVDPLDGTTNFIHGLPIFSISVALSFQNEIILGIVHELNRDECFHAIKDGKAFCNQNQIQVSDNTDKSKSLIVTGFPYHDFKLIQDYLNLLEEIMKSTRGIRRLGSAAVDLAYVACGRFDAFFEYNLNAWDVAAGAFIVQQAGGIVTDFGGGANFVFGREIVAANATHYHILNTIHKHWSKT